MKPSHISNKRTITFFIRDLVKESDIDYDDAKHRVSDVRLNGKSMLEIDVEDIGAKVVHSQMGGYIK